MKTYDWERRCLDAMFAATIPASGDTPSLGGLDLDGFWERFERAAPFELKLGLRVAVIGLGVGGPLLLLKTPRSFLQLDDASRDRMLSEAIESSNFLVRQLATVLKVVACMAYFDDPTVQARVRAGRLS